MLLREALLFQTWEIFPPGGGGGVRKKDREFLSFTLEKFIISGWRVKIFTKFIGNGERSREFGKIIPSLTIFEGTLYTI